MCCACAGVFGEQEIAPEPQLPCFPGAYYRKAVSSTDLWSGIEGVITLPQVHYDITRKRSSGRPADNASIYMGGKAGNQEVDAGLSWEVIRESDGSISSLGKAFRPFWRDSVRRSWNSGPAKPDYYFYPGDTVRMACYTTETGKLALSLQLLSRAGEQLSTAPLSSFTTSFEAVNFGPTRYQQFKRVNAVDQSGNEGKSVQVTSTTVDNARWHAVWLMRQSGVVPMTGERMSDLRCPSGEHFKTSEIDANGGETIDIIGFPTNQNSLVP